MATGFEAAGKFAAGEISEEELKDIECNDVQVEEVVQDVYSKPMNTFMEAMGIVLPEMEQF